MAGFAGAKIGFIVGGPVGGIIGGVIGSIADQFLINALFPPEDVRGPRVDSIRLSFASEGAPIAFAAGTECAAAGVVIWMSPIREVEVEEDVPGKGGGQTTERIQYRGDIAVAYADGDPIPGGVPSDAVEKIFADGNMIYDRDADISITSNLLSVERTELFENPTFPLLVTKVIMRVRSTAAGPDLRTLRSGRDVTITGMAAGGNNGTFRVKATGINGTNETSFTCENTACVNASAGATVTLAQNNNEFRPADIDSITFYPGDYTQGPDPTIESIKGVGNAHGYRGTAYFVLENMNFDAFGGHPPGSWMIVFRTADTVTVADGISQVLVAAGRAASDYDVTDVTGDLRGLVIRQPRDAKSALSTLMKFYDVLDQDVGGQLVFFSRVNAETVELDETKLAAHIPGSNPSRVARLRDDPGSMEVPRRVEVTYVDPDAEFQDGSQPYARNAGMTDDTINFRFDLVMTAAEAQCAARRLLWETEANRRNFSDLNLPPSMMFLAENDLIETLIYGRTRTLLVRDYDRSPTGLLNFRGVEEIASTITFTAGECTVDESGILQQELYVPTELELYVLDIAPLRDADASVPTYYWIVAAIDANAIFAGASLYESTTGAFSLVATTPVEGAIGMTTTELGTAIAGLWDRKNVVRVELLEGSVSSKTETEVLNGGNRAIIGDEIIGFATATLVTTNEDGRNVYDLSTLLRGQRDTEDQITEHSANQRFSYLNDSSLAAQQLNAAAIGVTRTWKAVSAYGIAAQFTSQEQFNYIGASVRPFSPANIVGVRDGSNNLTVTWDRRTRLIHRAISGNPVPQDEPDILFELDILATPGGTVLRTKTSSDITLTATGGTVVYTAAEQTTDGLTPGNPVNVEAFQLSTVAGRSKERAKTV